MKNIKIITDTATLFTPSEGEEMGITVIPVCVNIDGETYKDYVEITSEVFLDRIKSGSKPSSSQPSLGDILEVYESSKDEILMITVGDGLSGGYQTALGARNLLPDPERIHVVNSKTLAGPLRYLVKKALSLKTQGLEIADIQNNLNESIESSVSFVIPEDFDFLKRSGRLTPIAAKIGGALKLLPVLTQTADKTRIKPVTIKRTWNAAINTITHQLEEIGIDQNYLISISHAGTYDRALSVSEHFKTIFPYSEIEILDLSPALITHGGPGCIVVQAVKK